MKLIVGLGNPGLSYANTRHNLGARAVRAIAKEYRVGLKLNRSFKSRIAKIVVDNDECLLAIPSTYMNLSGQSIGLLLRLKKISPQDLLVIYDDVDLDLGVMRFRKKGGSGGHKGIKSVIETINTQDFNRLRLGIGRGHSRQETKDYVLTNFLRSEIKTVNSAVKDAAEACRIWIKFGPDKAMNEFN